VGEVAFVVKLRQWWSDNACENGSVGKVAAVVKLRQLWSGSVCENGSMWVKWQL